MIKLHHFFFVYDCALSLISRGQCWPLERMRLTLEDGSRMATTADLNGPTSPPPPFFRLNVRGRTSGDGSVMNRQLHQHLFQIGHEYASSWRRRRRFGVRSVAWNREVTRVVVILAFAQSPGTAKWRGSSWQDAGMPLWVIFSFVFLEFFSLYPPLSCLPTF